MATEANALSSQSSVGVTKLLARLLNLTRKDLAIRYGGDVANLPAPVLKNATVVNNSTSVRLGNFAARKVTVYNDTGATLLWAYHAAPTIFAGIPTGAVVVIPVVSSSQEIDLNIAGAGSTSKTIGYLVEDFS